MRTLTIHLPAAAAVLALAGSAHAGRTWAEAEANRRGQRAWPANANRAAPKPALAGSRSGVRALHERASAGQNERAASAYAAVTRGRRGLVDAHGVCGDVSATGGRATRSSSRSAPPLNGGARAPRSKPDARQA